MNVCMYVLGLIILVSESCLNSHTNSPNIVLNIRSSKITVFLVK